MTISRRKTPFIVLAVLDITLLAGCKGTPEAPSPTGESRAFGGMLTASDQNPSTEVYIEDRAWNVMQQKCVWCHTPEHPVANLDLTRRTQSLADLVRIGAGVQLEMAPLVERLSEPDKNAILDWVEASTGPLPPVTIPATVHWELQSVIAGLPDGAPVPGFGFVVEDGFIDPGAWKVATYTDRFGITARGVALDQTHANRAAVYVASRNPSSYFVFKGVPWHGRFYDGRFEGDVRVGRWMSVGMQAQDMSPIGRSHRDYVRLQFDRDAISLHSAPTDLETWPWGGTAMAPGADARLAGDLDVAGFYQRDDEWLHFVLSSKRANGGVQWHALVTRRGTGVTVADLTAFETNPEPTAGTFFLHAYAVGGKRNWANLVYDASIEGGEVSSLPEPPAPPPAPRRIRPGESRL